jgi:hypothetical protein
LLITGLFLKLLIIKTIKILIAVTYKAVTINLYIIDEQGVCLNFYC